jgi:hypothetical protein
MDPNSAHQQWSEWILALTVPTPAQPAFAEMQLAFGRLAAAVFGRAGQMKIEQAVQPGRIGAIWTITVQVEGESVFQPGWREHVRQAFTQSARRHFGDRARLDLEVRLLAGQTVDASPSSQWLIMPEPIAWGNALWGQAVQHKPPPQGVGLPTVRSANRVW